MKSQQKHNWIVDAVLLVGFLLLFFMDITGLSLHQWLGVAVGVIAGYHLLSHAKWVIAVIERFFGRTSNQARGFLLLDFAILGGLATIGFTGLIMSTWLNLTLAYYDAWYFVHVLSSIATLLLVVFKVALHGKWIVTVARNAVFAPKKATVAAAPAMAPVKTAPANANLATRREFLGMMGVVGVASLVALGKAAGSLRIPDLSGDDSSSGSQTVSNDGSTTGTTNQTTVQQAVESTSVPTTAATTAVESADVEEVAADTVVEATAVPTATTASVQVVEVTAVSCTTRCRKGNHCSYPGECHDYVDQNGNGLCDKGECS